MEILIKRGKRNNKGKRQEMETLKEGRRKKQHAYSSHLRTLNLLVFSACLQMAPCEDSDYKMYLKTDAPLMKQDPAQNSRRRHCTMNLLNPNMCECNTERSNNEAVSKWLEFAQASQPSSWSEAWKYHKFSIDFVCRNLYARMHVLQGTRGGTTQVCYEIEYYCLWTNEKKIWTLSSWRKCKAHNTISDTVLTEETDLQHQLPHLPKEDCITRHTTFSSSDSQANGSQKRENIQSQVKVRGNIPSLNS